jgi:hypothetical protein
VAGLPPIGFHDLRHTFATLQLAPGTNRRIASEVLGHQEVAITLDRNSRALPTLHTKAMARLDAIKGQRADAAPRTAAIRAQVRAPRPAPRQTKGPIRVQQIGLKMRLGTAYRIPSETSHVSQSRQRSATRKHMRRMRQDP